MSYDFKLKCYEGDEKRIIVTDEFIEKNKLVLMSPEEIEKLMENDFSDDFLGFKTQVAIDFLPWETAKKYFNVDYIKEIEKGEKEFFYVDNVAEATQDFLDYMVFAWMKATDERGISASRSISKLSTWMRILNRKDISDILEDESLYTPYGKPALVKACKQLGISYPSYLEK